MMELSWKDVQRLARICGPRSEPARALFIAQQRQSGGQIVRFFVEGKAIIVTPVGQVAKHTDGEGGGNADQA